MITPFWCALLDVEVESTVSDGFRAAG